jgi:spore coat protein CotH
MSAVADLDQMTRMWAAEAYLGHWDGYASWNTNNYYLHADGDGRFTMLPWGTDQTLVDRTAFYEASS